MSQEMKTKPKPKQNRKPENSEIWWLEVSNANHLFFYSVIETLDSRD